MAKTAAIVVNLSSNGAYWQAWWFDGDGQRQRQGIGAKSGMSERQATKPCQELANELGETAGKRRGDAPRLVDFVKRCVESRSGLSKGSRYLYDLTGRFLRAHFGDTLRIDKITRSGARDWRTALANGELQPVPVAEGKAREWQGARGETTACNNARYARAMFAEAVADDLIPFNPFDKLKISAPDPEKADWHYITLTELVALVASARPKAGSAWCRSADWQASAGAKPWPSDGRPLIGKGGC
jgi:hypothetical protein